jgi:SAM-dependent methyltransferase
MAYTNPAAYERFMGRWSAKLAPPFLGFAGIGDDACVLDVGCGTGSLSWALLEREGVSRVIALDPTSEYVAYAAGVRVNSRVSFQVGSAAALPYADGVFDASLALLILQELAEAQRAVSEMARVVRAGGIVAACQWDFRGGIPMFALFWQAAEAVAPDAVARRRANAPPRRDFASTDELRQLWAACGLGEITTTVLEIAMEFRSFDDYWLPFLGGATPSSAFAQMLERETGGALSRRLRASIPSGRADGSFTLPARAWAVRGKVAGGRLRGQSSDAASLDSRNSGGRKPGF